MRVGVLFAILVVAGFWLARAVIFHGSAERIARAPMTPGNSLAPSERSVSWSDQSKLTERVLKHWAAQPLGDWKKQGKIKAPRALLARFLLERDLDSANDYLIQQEPWGTAGSTWAGHPDGDYDFTMAALTPILFLFGDKPAILYPKTRDHLLNVLLPLEAGEPLVTVPGSFGLVRDTENHLLMTEGSRYLKNRWLATHGHADPRYDNEDNGLEEWLLNLISELRSAGLYEFNSIPYEGYTLTALLNLDAYGSPKVKTAARDLLDHLNWNYAIGSLAFRRFPPFRRQYKHAGDTALDGDRHAGLVKPWMSLFPNGPTDLTLKHNWHVAIWACWAPYRLPDETARWILDKPHEYFARVGHGPQASPEIYSGGPDYLLTAGGVNRGERSLIVARPITLMLHDGAKDVTQVLHLAGPGDNFRGWNNTGVWRRFAVAAGAVQIPSDWTPDAESELWKVFQREQNICVAVHSREDLGIIHLVRSSDPAEVLSVIQEANIRQDELERSFQIPNGPRVHYNVTAPQDKWVIRAIDDQPVDQDFDKWAQLNWQTSSEPTSGDQ